MEREYDDSSRGYNIAIIYGIDYLIVALVLRYSFTWGSSDMFFLGAVLPFIQGARRVASPRVRPGARWTICALVAAVATFAVLSGRAGRSSRLTDQPWSEFFFMSAALTVLACLWPFVRAGARRLGRHDSD